MYYSSKSVSEQNHEQLPITTRHHIANIPAASDIGYRQNSIQVIQKHNPTDAKNWLYGYVKATITIQKDWMGAVQLDTLQIAFNQTAPISDA